jgi:hypothetical protein
MPSDLAIAEFRTEDSQNAYDCREYDSYPYQIVALERCEHFRCLSIWTMNQGILPGTPTNQMNCQFSLLGGRQK